MRCCHRSVALALLLAMTGAVIAPDAAVSGAASPQTGTERTGGSPTTGAAVPTAEPSEACLVAGSDQSVVIGRLGLQEGFGPAAFIVTVPQGVCLSGTEVPDKIEKAFTVQLYSNTAEGFQDLYRMAGERVYVRGRASGQRTFQQRAPIIVEVIEIATK